MSQSQKTVVRVIMEVSVEYESENDLSRATDTIPDQIHFEMSSFKSGGYWVAKKVSAKIEKEEGR